jgi:hypothetical protein
MRKKMIGILVCTLMIASIITSATGNLNEESVEYQDGEIISTIYVNNYEIQSTEEGDYLATEDFGRNLIPGKPDLPSKIFAIAIPPGAQYTDISYELGEEIILPGSYDIIPCALPTVIGVEDSVVHEEEVQTFNNNYEEIYNSDEPYPASNVEFVRTAGFRKYNLVDVRVTPYTYKPVSGQLVYYPEITVSVSYAYPNGFNPEEIMTDTVENFEQRASEFILNHNEAKEWYNSGQGGRETYDYVIITLESLENYVTDLVSWEESKGKSVKVVTVEWIDSSFSGVDLEEKMRNFLIEKYPSEEWGIEFVCLIGDYDDVPIRLTAQNTGYGRPDTDFYYAELSEPDSQSWDKNQNQQYGETSGDIIDFYAEVYVGRIPWSDSDVVEHICQKSAAYEQNNDDSYKKNILLIGTFFWPDTDNAVLMEYKTDEELHPWMTEWTRTTMYEEAQSNYECDYDVAYDTVETVWSEGTYAFVDWAGHGSPTACYEYYPSQAFVNTDTCLSLNDDYPAIVFADACSNSDTDYDNIGQMMMKQGAIGFLGSTKVAYGMHGWNDPLDGSSQSLDYWFTTGLTSGDYTQGESHQIALQNMYENGLWYYELLEHFEWGALWGNPALQMGILNLPPDTPNAPNGPDQGITDKDYTFTASTTDPEDDEIWYMFDWDDGTTSDWIGPYQPGAQAEGTHSWAEAGDYEIRVRPKDELGLGEWSEPHIINIVTGPLLDVQPIRGGFFKISTHVKNVGATVATDVDWSISITGGTIFYGERTHSGTISSIAPDAIGSAETGPILGWGDIHVTATAEIPESNDDRDQNGKMYIIYIRVNPGGD